MSGGAFTEDAFCSGSLTVRQPREGYRFSIDAVLLAGHVRPRRGATVLDLGAGCGIISLLLARRRPDLRIVAVEVQEPLAALARRNVEANELDGQIRVAACDLRMLPNREVSGPFDVLVCNPPYRPLAAGRINPDGQRAVARHEIRAALADVAAAGRRMVKTGGRLHLIYPSERLADLVVAFRSEGLEPKRLRPVCSRAAEPARLVILEAAKGGRPGMRVEAALAVYGEDGGYSGEVQRMFDG